MQTAVGVIGLGAMGKGMAQSLRRAGHAVRVFDVRSELVEDFARDGGIGCASVAALASVTRYAQWRYRDGGELAVPSAIDRARATAVVERVLEHDP